MRVWTAAVRRRGDLAYSEDAAEAVECSRRRVPENIYRQRMMVTQDLYDVGFGLEQLCIDISRTRYSAKHACNVILCGLFLVIFFYPNRSIFLCHTCRTRTPANTAPCMSRVRCSIMLYRQDSTCLSSTEAV